MTLLRSLIFACVAFVCVPVMRAQTKVNVPNLTFTTIDVPGAVNTVVEGINSFGQTVGYYYNDQGYATTAFELSDGNFSFFNYPNAYSVARSINDSGSIVGYAYPGGGTTAVGYLYDGTTFTTIKSSYPDTYAEGIDNAGDIVGSDGYPNNHAFALVQRNFHDITPPPGNWLTAIATSINNLGQVVGLTWGSDIEGFFYHKGKFATLTAPGNSGTTEPGGINDGGIVVGSYTSCTPGCYYHGFASLKGKYLTFDYPGATETFSNGINASGQIVGTYYDGQSFHGFVTSPITEADFR